MDYYMGIDISKQTLSLFDGKEDGIVANTPKLEEFQAYLQESYGKRWKKVRLIYEPTGPYAYALRRFASGQGMKVFVLNPKQSAHFKRALGLRSKTDVMDARMLYRFKDLLKEEEAKVPTIDPTTARLSSYLKTYALIQKVRKIVGSHLYAHGYDEHFPIPLAQAMQEEASRLQQLETALVEALKTFAETTEELREDFALLQSIPGVGTLSAAVLLELFRRYPPTNRSRIVALAGLDPTRKESGISLHGRSRISKAGSDLLRRILYFSCLSAVRSNDRLQAFYQHLLEEHKPKKVALIACMKKMILIAHQIYTKKEGYRPMVLT